MSNHKKDVIEMVLGVATTGGGIGLSLADKVEQGLRIASLCVGLTIGILTLCSIIRRWRKNQ